MTIQRKSLLCWVVLNSHHCIIGRFLSQSEAMAFMTKEADYE